MMKRYRKAFFWIGLGLGFLCWIKTENFLTVFPPWFVCIGIGHLLDARSEKSGTSA